MDSTDDGLVGVIGVRGLELEIFDASTLESRGRAASEGPTHVVVGLDKRFYVADTCGGVKQRYARLRGCPRTGAVRQRLLLRLAVDPEHGHL